MTGMTDEVVGRDREWAIVQASLNRPLAGPRALTLEGEAGIGKSTLWSAAVAAARHRFPHVLTSRPAESESTLTNVVLSDLFGETPAQVLAAIPGPRRRALERVLLMAGEDDMPGDPRALGAAVLSTLSLLAAEGPLLLAIDDDQWADRSSIATLSFAMRRLPAAPILLLLARRVDSGFSEGSGLDRSAEAAAGPAASERIELGPLSIGAIQRLIQSRLGVALSRPNLLRLTELSRGNPFFALELARAQPSGIGPAAPFVVPSSLERLLAGRLDRLDDATRRGLLFVTANGRASLELLLRLGVAPDVIDHAVADRLLESSGGVVRFSHPLLASVIYQRGGPAELRAVHVELARAVDDPVGRARHLALSTTTPDDTVAADLESAARVARTRGLPIVEAELAEHALRLTPTARGEDTLRRRAAAVHAHIAAGEPGLARALVLVQLAQAPAGVPHAEALMLASELEEPGSARGLLEQALDEAFDSLAVQATAHVRLGMVGMYGQPVKWAEQHVQAGLAAAQRVGDEELRIAGSAVLAVLRFEGGYGKAFDLARDAYRSAVAFGDPDLLWTATWAVGHELTFLRHTVEARTWLEAYLAGQGDEEMNAASCLHYLALVELWAGRWDIALAHAQKAAAIDAQYGIEVPHRLVPLALVLLFRGQFSLARGISARAIELAAGRELGMHAAILGLADLWSGRPDDAIAKLASVNELRAQRGVREPGLWIGNAEYVEALLQVGRVDDARRFVADWESAAVHRRRLWTTAEVVRSKGLLAAAQGALDLAAERLEEATRRHEACGDPFGRGRAFFALGQVRRRQRQKRLARESLETARAAFEALGAASFVAASRRELGRLGGRMRLEGLSPSELRVAELVANGGTNREVASALFLGQRTVESHLRHIYAKLGVRSRTELARYQFGERGRSERGTEVQ
jgi:DNA-binding CsgD family transcriptional regulator